MLLAASISAALYQPTTPLLFTTLLRVLDVRLNLPAILTQHHLAKER